MSRVMLAILAVACLLVSRGARGQDVDELLQQATQASQRGERERAIARYSDAIKLSPAAPITALRTQSIPRFLHVGRNRTVETRINPAQSNVRSSILRNPVCLQPYSKRIFGTREYSGGHAG
jgi:hypothetical protein